MSETQWDAKLKAFLKKTGDDFKRAGAEMKVEANRLLSEAKDPERAKKIKDGLTEVSVWAKKTAEELAGIVETGVKKAEDALKDVVAKPAGASSQPSPVPETAYPTAAPPEVAEKAAPAAATAPKKTVGRGAKKSSPGKKASAKKPLGRAKR